MSSKNTESTAPDFAFPQQVIKDADKMLNKALKEGDGTAVVDALIRSGLAQTAISPDTLPSVIRQIETVNSREKDEVTKALLDLLLANIYGEYYQDNKYNFDARPELAEPGEDITLWSGKEFRDRIIGLYEHALTYAPALKKARITDYSTIVTCDKTTAIFYPTLYDFASEQAIDGITEVNNDVVEVLSPMFFYDFRIALPNVLAKPSRTAIEIATRRVEGSTGAARISALLSRYDLIEGYMVDDDSAANDTITPLMRLYEENKSTPYAVELLLSEDVGNLNISDRKAMYYALRKYAVANPTYFRINMVKNALAELSQTSAELSFPSYVARGQEFTVEVKLENTSSMEVLVYRVNDSKVNTFDRGWSRGYKLSDCQSTPVARIPVKSSSAVPFSETKEVKVKLPEYGVYVVTTSLNTGTGSQNLMPIYCSDMALIDVNGNDVMRVFAVDGRSGAPLSDVSVTTYEDKGGKTNKLRTHVTGSDGSVNLNKGNIVNLTVRAEKGDDRFAPSLSEYLYKSRNKDVATTAFIKTSLAIYHPGDTIDFVAVVYEYQGENRSLVKNAKFKATLRNPNNEFVDTIDVVTDDFGRASAQFNLPEEGLTGEYSIVLSLQELNLLRQTREVFVARHLVMVSDYKLPTYEATVDSIAVNDETGMVTVRGKALMYSGFPVQNAVVEASLYGAKYAWMWGHNAVKYHTDTLTTDAEGVFSWELPKAVLDGSPYKGGRYEVAFTLTSPSGENRSCKDEFAVSKETVINVENAMWWPAVKDARLNIAVLNPLGAPVEASLRLTFIDENGKEYVTEGCSSDGIINVDLSSLESGRYHLAVTAIDVEAEKVETMVTVYNTADAKCPETTGIWTPSTSVKVKATDRKGEIIYGVPTEDAHVLMSIYKDCNLIEQKWLDTNKGMNRLMVAVPDSITKMSVRLSTVSNFEEWAQTFTVSVEDPDATLKVKVERMRDNLTPLSEETVTVKVSNGAGNGVGAAVILDMYSKALDNLATQSWKFNPSTSYMNSMSYGNNLTGAGSNMFTVYYDRLPAEGIGVPQFNFYGKSWMSEGMIFGNGPVLLSRTHKMGAYVLVEEATLDNEVMYEPGATAEEKEEATVAEKAEENQYRPSEVPLAFFAPMLTTNDSGELTYSFVVPNANTTWVLNALAYNEELATDLDIKEIISSKPIMVEPNMPRFLRTGDRAEIRAMVMNATESPATVTTTFEILDPSTGEVVDTQVVKSEIGGRESETVKFGVSAPATSGAMMVRVKSATDDYSDGVMTLLPILSSSQPVVESTTFYLTPDQKEYEQQLQGAREDSTVTLSFCENPTWEVVSALPGLRTNNATTSLAASAQVFAAAVSEYVMQINPAIEPALKEWLATAGDDNMLSKLNQNEELKQLVLASTPWVQEAKSDEERITRLAMLFDRKEIARNMKSGVAQLQKLQRANGGWSWTDSYDETSEWVTLLILNNFAELRQLGCYPEELDEMVPRALRFIDNEVSKSYEKYPKWDYTYYAYVRSLYKDVDMSLSAQEVYDKAVQQTVKDWKKSSVAGKAADALLLYRSGYQNVARQVLESLREYAITKPELGMWWDSVDRSSWHSLTGVGQTAFILEAFNTIEPGCPETDKIRQWLILNKTVQDWGTSVDASACVASILQCGTSWLNRPGDAVITIAGAPVEIDRIDKLTGQVVTTITDAAGELKIERSAEGPAWGAVVTQSNQVMRDVKAHSIPELSIDKQLFVRGENGWAPTDNMTVGQVVKVRLVMTAQRDMSYVTVVDNRAATFEPVVQTPRPVYCDGLVFYLENRDASTNLFIDFMPKGQYVVEYEVNVNNSGEYSSGIATIQSQYTPEMTAHSSGTALTVAD